MSGTCLGKGLGDHWGHWRRGGFMSGASPGGIWGHRDQWGRWLTLGASLGQRHGHPGTLGLRGATIKDFSSGGTWGPWGPWGHWTTVEAHTRGFSGGGTWGHWG